MSTVLLKKPHGEHKAGESISVPFGVGQTLIAKGIGEYPKKSAAPIVPNVATPIAGDRHTAEIKRLNAMHASTIQDVRDDAEEARKKREKEHAAELAAVRAELEAAQKTIAEMNATKK